MKPLLKKIVLIALLCSVCQIQGQHKAIQKAHILYDNFAFAEAIEPYNELIKKGNGTLEIYKRLGDCYYHNSNLEDAARWYDRMWLRQKELQTEIEDTTQLEYVLKESLNIPAEYYFRTAQSYKFLKKYKQADRLMMVLKEKSISDSRADRLIQQPNYLEEVALQSGRYEIKDIPLNSLGVDFAPSFYKDYIVFSSSRSSVKSEKKNQWTQQPYLDLYKFLNKDSLEGTYSQEFSKEVNSRLHESTSAFTKDGTTMYFTRNNLLGSQYGKDSTGVNRLKIYRTYLDDQSKWSIIEELPFNNDQYSVAHPALSPNGTKLYFASDMPGGYGMSDLYVVDVHDNGTFGTPQNLGPKVNTEGRDTFPFISESGVLYFSSDGHLGLGGLDVFAMNLNDPDMNIYNIGEPINSVADDITFVINEVNKKGYFASNRGGKGNDNIYSFIELKPLITICKGSLRGVVKDQKSGQNLADANIIIKNKNQEVVYNGITDGQGIFMLEVSCDETYEIEVTKKDYDKKVKTILIPRDQPFYEETVALTSSLPEEGIDLAKLLNLKPIYFASNKAFILEEIKGELDKVVLFMKENKTILIEIGSHTDSKGSDSYNLKLSQRRATATANYIISKGVDPSRVQHRGYGETVLINSCGNAIKCSKEEHALNRRSEFIVVRNYK